MWTKAVTVSVLIALSAGCASSLDTATDTSAGAKGTLATTSPRANSVTSPTTGWATVDLTTDTAGGAAATVPPPALTAVPAPVALA